MCQCVLGQRRDEERVPRNSSRKSRSAVDMCTGNKSVGDATVGETFSSPFSTRVGNEVRNACSEVTRYNGTLRDTLERQCQEAFLFHLRLDM